MGVLTEGLTNRDAAEGCAFAAQVVAESRVSEVWAGAMGEAAALLRHKNSLVRNRAISVLAANARWDAARPDEWVAELLAHIADEKPITARWCIQALPELAAARPEHIGAMLAALRAADFSPYRDSMRPLLERDAAAVMEKLQEIQK